MAFTLNALTATITGGNTTSDFYQFDNPGESGSASGLYSNTSGGSSTTGWWVQISFDGNPQPILESAFIKASNGYLWWDSSDLAAFNAGTFDSIILVQDGLWNNPHNALHAISHAGINGSATSVPDGGATAVMVGLGFVGLSLGAARRIKR